MLPLLLCLPAALTHAQSGGPGPAPVAYLEVNLGGWLDAGSAKPGHGFSATALNPWVSPACNIEKNAKVYGHVVAATKASKTDKSSSIALAIDAADCGRQKKVPLAMIVVEVLGRPDSDRYAPDNIPHSAITNTGQLGSMGDDTAVPGTNVSADVSPANVHPGTVQDLSDVRLQLDAGPDHSSLLRGSGENLRLIPGTRLILASADAAPALITMQEDQ